MPQLRIAIVSDIHGNLTALEAILPAIKSMDKVVCLGDVAAVGPQPHETVAFLRKSRWPCVMGNADETLAKSSPEDYTRSVMPQSERKRMVALDRWTAAQLTEEDRAYLTGFRPTITARAGKRTLLCYHGSPRSNVEGILPTTPEEKLWEVFKGHSATIFAGGHTHTQMVRRLGGSMVINPGSVGLPFQKDAAGKATNPSLAEYSVVTIEGGDVSVELRRAKYDRARLERAVRSSGLPNPDWWLEGWV